MSIAIDTAQAVIVHERHFIDGRRVPATGSGSATVHDSSRGVPIARVALGDARDVDAAVAAARRAWQAWKGLAPGQRAAYLEKIADALAKAGAELAREISREVGMPLKLAQRIQVDAPIANWRATAQLAAQFAFERTIGNSRVVMEPVGVLAAITPWNYPLHQITLKLAPALLAGCTVVLKPSEIAPAATARLIDALVEAALPPGVVNVVFGGAEAGTALVEHPEIDMVSFTGSTAVGRRVAAAAAGRMKRIALELGGKSAALVTEGADLAKAVKATVASCFLNSGQTCSAITRLVVPRSKYEECNALLAETVAAMKVGDPADKDTRVGPLISQKQKERVLGFIREAEAAGFDLIAGGSRADVPADGFFVAPTVFGNVPAASRLAREEVFGPVLAVQCYDSLEEGVALANGTAYGLAGAVWAGTAGEGEAIARRIRAGQVDVNGARFNAAAPFGGFGHSGMGREGGVFGLEEFVEPKSIQLP